MVYDIKFNISSINFIFLFSASVHSALVAIWDGMHFLWYDILAGANTCVMCDLIYWLLPMKAIELENALWDTCMDGRLMRHMHGRAPHKAHTCTGGLWDTGIDGRLMRHMHVCIRAPYEAHTCAGDLWGTCMDEPMHGNIKASTPRA